MFDEYFLRSITLLRGKCEVRSYGYRKKQGESQPQVQETLQLLVPLMTAILLCVMCTVSSVQ